MADNLGEYSVLRPNGSIVSTEIKNKTEAELFCDELNELLKENIELQGKASSWKITASEEISEKAELIKQISELNEENEYLQKRLQINNSDSIDTLNDLQRCRNNSIKAEKTIDTLVDENNKLKKENEKLKNANKSLCNFRNFTNIEHIRTKDENEQLKKALFFYLDIVFSESLTDFDKWCNLLFNCNYEEAKINYGDFEYKERWESE